MKQRSTRASKASTIALTLPLLVLTACALPTANGPVPDPQTYAITDAPIPFAVTRLLPRGVNTQDVRVADNCYGYVFDGQIYPVLIPRGTQYCL